MELHDLRTESSASVAEECYLLLPGFGFVPGADQESWSEAALQSRYQPTGWLQHVQTAAARGLVTLTHLHTLYCWAEIQGVKA